MPLYIGGAPYAENACDTPMVIDELRMYSVVSPTRSDNTAVGLHVDQLSP